MILVVSGDSAKRAQIRSTLKNARFGVRDASPDDLSTAAAPLNVVAALIADADDERAFRTLRQLRGFDGGLPILLLTSERSRLRGAAETAYLDFLVAPCSSFDLVSAVRRAFLVGSARRAAARLRRSVETPLSERDDAPPALAGILSRARALIGSRRSVWLVAPTPSDAEAAARAIHRLAPTRNYGYFTIDCDADAFRLDAELFGDRERVGRLELGSGGTVALRSFDAAPGPTRRKLAAFLRSNESTASLVARPIFCVSADFSPNNLESEFQALAQRSKIVVPPLGRRPSDAIALAETLLRELDDGDAANAKTLTPKAFEKIARYSWPGGVAELRATVRAAFAKTTTDEIGADALLLGNAASEPLGLGGLEMREIKRLALRETLELTNGDYRRAARLLSVSERTVYNMTRRHDLTKDER
ncbi:MAG: hypothetical protein IKK39_06125 [Thermoguttaceae bacterium]|nr:hypothetical protein [Thermoguttaceae bacterium]MBR4103623.1 hypothetical protein [Thermoguttaceae bacterium]